MTNYSDLFGSNKKSGYGMLFNDSKSLFGTEATKAVTDTGNRLVQIQNWLVDRNVQTSAKRIDYILNSTSVDAFTHSMVSDIGQKHVWEATEANRCVDQVVNDFSMLKQKLDEPKMLILEAISLIEQSGKPRGFLSFLGGSKQPNVEEVHRRVSALTDQAVRLYANLLKYHLDPFLDGIDGAKQILDVIVIDLDNTINALGYLIDNTKEITIKDLATRRKEMFAKSLALMQLNIGQMKSMEDICRQNKNFLVELEMTVLPIVENVLRSAVITGKNGFDEITKALKRMA